MFEIWTKKQREKFFEIPGFWKWFTASCLVTWLSFVLFIASFVYVANVADAVAIFDSHHIFVPLLGLCFKTGDQWKHRYFICLLIVVIGIFLIAQPHIISGYSIDNNSNQLIGVILSLCSAIFGAFVAVTFIMMKKLAYLDVMKQSIEQYIDILDDDDDNTSVDDKTPLLSQGITLYIIPFFNFLLYFLLLALPLQSNQMFKKKQKIKLTCIFITTLC